MTILLCYKCTLEKDCRSDINRTQWKYIQRPKENEAKQTTIRDVLSWWDSLWMYVCIARKTKSYLCTQVSSILGAYVQCKERGCSVLGPMMCRESSVGLQWGSVGGLLGKRAPGSIRLSCRFHKNAWSSASCWSSYWSLWSCYWVSPLKTYKCFEFFPQILSTFETTAMVQGLKNVR